MKDNTITIEQAESRLRAEYWDEVRSHADDARQAVKDGEVSNEDELREYVEQSVDGCGRVIYTGQAMDGLRWSDNDSAYIDDFGAEGAIVDGAINWSALMYAAMLADVNETIGDFGELFSDEDDDEKAE